MAAFKGDGIVLARGGTPLAGVQEKGVSLEGEAIDISDDDSGGWRQLLGVHGQRSVNISLSGVTKDKVLKSAWFNGTLLEATTLTYDDGGVISGSFFLANYSETGKYDEATTFEGELQSSGPVTYDNGA